MQFRYTDEQLVFLKEGFIKMTAGDLTAAFNLEYGTDKKVTAIRQTLYLNGFKSGRSGHFKEGGKPWNHGKKGCFGTNKTSFRKGNLPRNSKPLWSERINRSGYIEMSVPEKSPYTESPTHYKPKHVWVWEQANGKVKKGHVIIFNDGDKRNMALDNLTMVSRAELLYLSRYKYADLPNELKPTMRTVAKVVAKASALGRR